MTTLIAERIHDYCEEYTAILRSSFIKWRIQHHINAIQHDDSPAYHSEKIDQLTKGEESTVPKYEISVGKKYFKIILNDGSSRSVHAFVHKESGDVFKSASWNRPAKDARYNILIDEDRENCFNSVDPFGSYLYQ